MNLVEGQDNRVEQYLFHMPKDTESTIAAWVVICDYVELKKKQGVRPQVFLEGLVEDLQWLPDWSVDWLDHLQIPSEYMTLQPWDLDFYFEVDRAYAISRSTGKHIVQTFGLMVGCEPESIFPKLDHVPALTQVHTPNDQYPAICVVTHRPELSVQKDYLTTLIPNACVINPASKLKDILNQIANAEIIMAQRCAITYIAAALGKKVLEFYPGNVHRGWLSKWSSENWRMAYGFEPLESYTNDSSFAEFVVKILKLNKWIA